MVINSQVKHSKLDREAGRFGTDKLSVSLPLPGRVKESGCLIIGVTTGRLQSKLQLADGKS